MGSLFLVRHATTAASASGRNLGQASDPPLAPEGGELARRAGVTIRAELLELPHDELRIVASTARRCRETAGAIADALGIAAGAIEVDRALVELDYGAWEGLTTEECHTRDPELRAAYERDPFTTRCPDGESGADVAARAFGPLGRIEDWLAAQRSRCAIVVAHNHVNRLRLCDLLGWPMHEYRDRLVQDPGGYSIVTFGGRIPVVRRLNASPG